MPFVHRAVLSVAILLKLYRTVGQQKLDDILDINRTPTSELVTLPYIQT